MFIKITELWERDFNSRKEMFFFFNSPKKAIEFLKENKIIINDNFIFGDFATCEGDHEECYYRIEEITDEVMKKFNTAVKLPRMRHYSFTNRVAGRACNNGGEYGFYTDLYPTQVAGIFKVVTSTTCDFDRCGTGQQGFEFFSFEDIERMQATSDRIEAEGSLY